jgi:hypothetical protein
VLVDRTHDRPPAHAPARPRAPTPAGRCDRPGGTPQRRLAWSAPPAPRRAQRSWSTCVPRTTPPGNATAPCATPAGPASRTPADPGSPRASGPGPPSDPQPGQPTTEAVVSITITTSAGVSRTATTPNPSSPNNASAHPVRRPQQGPRCSFVVVTSHEDRGARAPRGGPPTTARPHASTRRA